MTKKQYAFIINAEQVIEQIRLISILGQDGCGNCDTAYYRLCEIEDRCNDFLNNFGDTDTNWTQQK